MQPFEFANNGLSLTLSIFSVIVGMAYPLFLQAIQRIDEMYHSSRISMMLLEESCFRKFKNCLVLSVAVSFSSLFILQIFDGNDLCTTIWMTIHVLATLSLLRYTILLFYTILDYYQASKLRLRIEKKIHSKHSYLLELFDIAKYATMIEDEETYRKSTEHIFNKLNLYIEKNREQQDFNTLGLRFTPEQTDVMKQILNMACKPKNEDNFFAHDSNLFGIWYPSTSYLPLSDETRRIIWYFVMRIIENDKFDLFMSYWTFANQYYTIVLDNESRDIERIEGFKEQRKKFRLFHLALGAVLLFKRKYTWLNKILYFTQSQPPTYPLIANTFVEILDNIKHINELKQKPGVLSETYKMSGLVNDVNSDADVAYQFYKYFALLTVRLNDMNYNVSYCDPKGIPQQPNDPTVNDLRNQSYDLNILLNLLTDREFLKIIEIIGYNHKQVKVIIKLIKNFQNNINRKINELHDNPQTDANKLKEIKDRLIEECKNTPYRLPTISDSELKGNIESDNFVCKQSVQVPLEDIAKGFVRISGNLEEVLVSSIVLQEQRFYNFFFLQNRPVVTFTIRYQDLMTAWKKLGINNQFTILSMGVYLGNYTQIYGKQDSFDDENNPYTYKGAKIINIPSSMRAFIIIPNDSLPYVEHVELQEEHKQGVECIDNETYLYSNVNNLNAKNNLLLTVKRGAQLVHSKDFTRYVLLNIRYNSDSSNYDINKIENIRKWIVAQ